MAVHDPTGADSVTYALIDAVFEGDLDIVFEGLEPTDPAAVDHVIGVFEGLSSIGRGGKARGQFIANKVLVAKLGYQFQVAI